VVHIIVVLVIVSFALLYLFISVYLFLPLLFWDDVTGNGPSTVFVFSVMHGTSIKSFIFTLFAMGERGRAGGMKIP